MKVLLIDADSKIPNLALMKLGRWWRDKGFRVDLVRLEIPYYPWRKRFPTPFYLSGYDRIFCSVVFRGSERFIVGRGIEYGGSGVDLEKTLSASIEACEPDYSLYPENEYSYGFLTRGCIRNCEFCIVPKKEGMIRQVAGIDDVVRHYRTEFLDNNILAFPGHYKLLRELVDRRIRCRFMQGLDIRLVNAENGELLRRMNYVKPYIFAFDRWGYLGGVKRGLSFLGWHKDWELRFYVYCNADWDLGDVIRRLEWLRGHKCLPYLMRDLNCWGCGLRRFYIYLNRWANMPGMFKQVGFIDALRHGFKELSAEERLRFELIYLGAGGSV